MRLASAAAVQELGTLLVPSPAGAHPLPGFNGTHPVFTF